MRIARPLILGVAASLALPGCIFFFDLIGTPPATTTDTSPDDTSPPPPLCLQQEAVDQGQIEYLTPKVSVNPGTYAVLSDAPPPSTALPSGFARNDYYGAVDPEGPAWWGEWTYRGSVDGGFPGGFFHPLEREIRDGVIVPASTSRCGPMGFTDAGEVDVFGASFPVCAITETILSDTELTNDHVYLLGGSIRVGTGDRPLGGGPLPPRVNLAIEAGTQIYGTSGTLAALVITRGSRIQARGTAQQPIVMGALEAYPTTTYNLIFGDPTNLSSRGLWGGLVLSGRGELNTSVGSDYGEAQSPSTAAFQPRFFGGGTNEGSSGFLNYVVIAEAGALAQAQTRLDALTLEAVGSATTIDYVQMLGSDGDCLRAFGGAPKVSHLVCNGPRDDGIDLEFGFTGQIQWALVRFGTFGGQRGLESDSNPDNYVASPVTAARIANFTVLGGGPAFSETVAAVHRTGARDRVYRAAYAEGPQVFSGGCFDVDDTLADELRYVDSLFSCSPQPIHPCGDDG
ncbi:MAG: hypothetical protein AAGA48_01445 [Myxococcota bacterium]